MKSPLLKLCCFGVLFVFIFQCFPQSSMNKRYSDESLQTSPESAAGPYFSSFLTTNSTALSPTVTPGNYDNLNISFAADNPANYNLTITSDSQVITSDGSKFASAVSGNTIYLIYYRSDVGGYVLYNSTDSGQEWKNMYNVDFGSAESIMGYSYFAFAISPGQAYWYIGFMNKNYSGDSNDFYLIRSVDQGKTWNLPLHINSTAIPPDPCKFAIDIAVNSTGAVYVMYLMTKEVGIGNNDGYIVIDVSTNNGDTWKTVGYYHGTPDSYQETAIAINPITDNVVGLWAINHVSRLIKIKIRHDKNMNLTIASINPEYSPW